PFEMAVNGTIYAQARKSGMYDSEIVSYEVNSNKVGNPSIKFEDLKVVITSDSREGVATYYTLDGSEPTEQSEAYTAPFSLTHDARVMARSFMTGLNPSDIAEYVHTHADYVTGAPEISVEDTTVTLTATTEGSTLYYSIDDPNPAQEYTAPFEMPHNGTVYAQARIEGMFDSEVVSQVVNSVKTATPYGQFDTETKLLTLKCDTEGAVISYSYSRNGSWTVYSEPILIEDNRTVYAKAEAPDYIESDVAEILVSEFKCASVVISYNGRYMTMTTEEPDVEIMFTIDGKTPSKTEGIPYSFLEIYEPDGLYHVKAVAVKEGYMNSDVAEYTIEVYADETHVETARGGVLKDAYGWADSEILDNMESVTVKGYLDADDYAVIRSLKGLRHINLSDVETDLIPDKALAGMRLVTASMPSKVEAYGDSIFSDNPNICAVIWNKRGDIPEDRLTEGVLNPNMLLYVLSEKDPLLTDHRSMVRSSMTNVIEDYGTHTTVIAFTDGYPVYIPSWFFAGEITYRRDFSKTTEVGGCAGWETLTVPFDVQEITDSRGIIEPFAVDNRQGRPFWLYQPSGFGWDPAFAITANMPYLIAMPNNPWYIDEYNISGEVTFAAYQVRVENSMESGYSYRNGALMWNNFSYINDDEDLWVVNDDWYEGNAPGSVFVQGQRKVRPFECYLSYDSSRRYLPIFDGSDVEEIMEKTGTKIWCENHDVCILSGIGQRINIYDTVGQLVRIADVKAGEICRVTDIAPGIYIVGSAKIMVK
ncbi:MAG: hypothetical protein HDR88_06695, partial [Bacteroides sp.]|nr:hypothetical protein [Bacteroides sp.]